MKQQPYSKPLPYSLLASMYAAWEEYRVPAVYYQYLLATLPNLDKKDQVLLMTREVKTLKANTHPYHRILNSIEARHRSLSVIKTNIHALMQFESTDEMQWPDLRNTDLQFGEGTQEEYRILHEDERGGILSPRPRRTDKKVQLMELINHVKMFRKVTLQIVYLIAQWEAEIKSMGYKDGIVQFQYHQEDYLVRINLDTSDLLDTYQSLFENNPFLLIKRAHEKTEFALIYSQLKPENQLVSKIHECLNIISNHEAEILKFRMLAKTSQKANSRRYLTKSTDLHKIYLNYNQGRDYIMVRDSQTMKKSKVVYDPPNLQAQMKESGELRKFKNDIVINPEGISPSLPAKTIKKYPIKTNLNKLADVDVARVQLKTPQIPQRKGHAYTPNSQINPEKSLKRSNTEDIKYLRKHRSVDLRKMEAYEQEIDVSQIHGKNTLLVSSNQNVSNSALINNREDQVDRNRGLLMQRKLQAMDSLAKQYKSPPQAWKKSNRVEKSDDDRENLVNSYVMKDRNMVQPEQSEKMDGNDGLQVEGREKKEEIGELSEDNQISLIFEESVKPTQIVKYLRNKVFNTVQIGFEQIQALAKKLILEKDFITFVRVESKGMKVAWLAVKFMEKDNIMRKTVFIHYVRKFLKLSNFERKLLDLFVSHGYGVIKNEEKILYEVDILEMVSRPLVKIKYKVSAVCEKNEIKDLMKKNKTLLNTRILKYHSYKKTTKYHKYCQHERNYCMIGYNFLEMRKICIDRMFYLQAKADKITKMADSVYKIHCTVNETDLIIAPTFTDILNLEKETEIEKDSSFDSKCETEYKYIALRTGKFMRKYVNESDQTIISQFVTVNPNIPEVRSIMIPKEEVSHNLLVIDPPFFLAVMNRDEEEAKTLAVIGFE